MEPPAVAAPPPAAVNISFFYEALAPYGNWLQVDGAQYWQPAAVGLDPDWQPYCQRGHWVNSDCGWAWYSDYSWGWAPFHYGRWRHDDRLGWIWAPDTVWGPAWVNWREHAGVIGWAPLPPGAVYVPGVGFTFQGRRVAVGFEFGLQARQYTFVEMRYFCELATGAAHVASDASGAGTTPIRRSSRTTTPISTTSLSIAARRLPSSPR